MRYNPQYTNQTNSMQPTAPKGPLGFQGGPPFGGVRGNAPAAGGLREVGDAGFEDLLVFVAGYVLVDIRSHALGMAHLAQDATVGAG